MHLLLVLMHAPVLQSLESSTLIWGCGVEDTETEPWSKQVTCDLTYAAPQASQTSSGQQWYDLTGRATLSITRKR